MKRPVHFDFGKCSNRLAAPLLAVALLLGGGCSTDTPNSQLPPLNTVPGSPRVPGKFDWADLVTDDVPAAQKFYSQMFGWTYRKVGDYVIASNDDRPLAGMFERPRPMDRLRPAQMVRLHFGFQR